MSFQGPLLTEGFSTDRTLMGLYSSMDLLVVMKAGTTHVTLATCGTLKRLFPIVDPAMAFQLRAIPEAFAAYGALVRPLTCVAPQVRLKARLLNKRFPTERTLMGLFPSV